MYEFLHISAVEAEPVEEPVSLEDAKKWAGVDHSDDDTLIESMIPGARYEAEFLTGRKLVPNAVTAVVRLTEAGPFSLPYGYTETLAVVDYETEEAVDTDDYKRIGGTLKLKISGTYQLTYTAGSSNAGLKQLVKMIVAYRYNNRSDDSESKLPADIIQKANQLRLEWL